MDKEKSIVTNELVIEGNILICTDSIVQISNISSISTYSFNKEPFPKLVLLVFLATLYAFNYSMTMAVVLFIAGIGWLLYWNNKNKELEKKRSLNIVMNSGNSLSIVVNDEKFLQKIIKVLGAIITKGGVGNKTVNISLDNNEFNVSGDGNANILNNLHIE